MFNPVIIENFIDKDVVEKILYFAKSTNGWEATSKNDYWDKRSLNDLNIFNNYSQEIGKELYEIRTKIAEAIKTSYDIKEIHPDILQLVRWHDGMEMGVHSDDMENTPAHEQLGYRDFGAIIYLNDDYTGGHTFYPEQDYEIIPKSGSLAIHPGDINHMHGVTKIIGNTRYTIASFWTKDAGKANDWKP